MEKQKCQHFTILRKPNGQVLTEALFLSLITAAILILFSHLIEFQKETKKSFYHATSTEKNKNENPR